MATFDPERYWYGFRRASLEVSLSSAYVMVRQNPILIVSALFGLAASAVAQASAVPIVMGGVFYLGYSGVLERIADSIEGSDASWISLLFEPSILIPILAVLLPAVLLSSLVQIISGGLANSAEYGAYARQIVYGQVSMQDLLDQFRFRWKKMAWTILVRDLLFLLSAVPLMVAVGFLFYQLLRSGPTVSSPPVPLLILLIPIAILGSLVAIFLVFFVSIYAEAAVVTENTSGLTAIRRSYWVATNYKGSTITYILLEVAVVVGSGLVSLQLISLGLVLSSLVGATITLAVLPVLHLAKTRFYFYASQWAGEYPQGGGPRLIADLRKYWPALLWRHFKIGFRTLGEYVGSLRNIPFHAISAALLGLGIIMGQEAGSLGVTRILSAFIRSSRDGDGFGRIFPPSLGVDLFVHNWQASMMIIVSGLWTFLPGGLTMLLNGFVIGVVSELEPNLVKFLAAIIPHGIIELPSFVVAGSCGIRIGYRLLMAKMRGIPLDELGFPAMLREAIYVGIGLVPLFFLAGMVEAMLTPQIMRMYGWE